MSKFQDPYLAESVGYTTGHSNGIAQGVEIGRQQGYSSGLKDGYTQGWNSAADEANAKIAKQDKAFAELNQKSHRNYDLMTKEIEKLTSKREELKKEIFSLADQVEFLHKKNQALSESEKSSKRLYEESIQILKAESEHRHMAFLGVVSMARSAMRVVASVSAEEQSVFLDHYADLAVELQSIKYIDDNAFPHDQALINPYISDASQLLKETIFPRVRAYRAKPNE